MTLAAIMNLLCVGTALVCLDQVFVVELPPAEDVTPVAEVV